MDDFIGVYDGALSPEHCDALVARFEASDKVVRGRTGNGTRSDLKAAARGDQAAANSGHLAAQERLALLYIAGNGVEADEGSRARAHGIDLHQRQLQQTARVYRV